jgi:progesterone-induced-blocking factor 1
MSESDSSEVLRDIAQQLGLSQFSASLIDLEPISDGSSEGSIGAPDPSLSRFSHGLRSYESHISQRDLVIDAIRQQHHQQLDALHEKLRQTESSIQMIKQRFEEKLSAMNQRHLQEKNEMKAETDAEIKRLKDLNRAHRQNLAFSRLPQLTPEEYESLTSRPITDLSLPQFLAVQLHELRISQTRTSADANAERSALSAEAQKLRAQLESASAELLTERELRLSLESRLAGTTRRIGPRASPAATPEESAKLRKCENELAELKAAYQVALSRLNEAQERRDSAVRKGKDYQGDLSQAKAEISSLRAQLQAITTLAERQEGILQQQYTEITELKRMRDDFFNRFMQTSEARRSDFGNLLKTEVERLSERSRSDVDYIREVSEKMREREFKILSQSHESAVEESKQMRLDLRRAEEERAKLQAEYQTLQLAHEAELTRISSDLRVKSYELERIKLVYDELKAAHEDLTDDRDALAAKFDIVKQEVMKLTQDVKIRDHEIHGLSGKVSMYEKLENELDLAIETLDLNSVGGIAVPSDANRRIKQSVMLARRVMQLQQANNQLTAECESLKQELVSASSEKNELKAQLEASGQPQQVFVVMLNEKQQEINALKAKLAAIQEMNQELVHEKESLQKDVKTFSRQTGEIAEARRFAGYFLCHDTDEPTRETVDPEPFIITRRD